MTSTSTSASVPVPAGTCNCPPGAQATAGRVTVTGHQAGCAGVAARTYTWRDGGQTCTGTLADYADAFAVAHDESLPAGELAGSIRDTAQGTVYTVRAACLSGEPDKDEGYWRVLLSVPGEQITVPVWALSQPFPPAAAAGDIRAEDEDPAPVPAAPDDVHEWMRETAWTIPFVLVKRDPDSDGTRLVAARRSDAGVLAELDTGQVFLLTAVELTGPTGHPEHPYTLNPPGQRSMHADLDGGPLCALMTADETVTGEWAKVTCLDCQAAEPGRDLAALDDLDRAMAAREARNAVIAASPEPLALYPILRRVSPQYRAAVPAGLVRLCADGELAVTTPPGRSQQWSWPRR